MGWKTIDRNDSNVFDSPSFDYGRYYKFIKKYGYTQYSGPPMNTDLETFLLTKSDEKRKNERGLPPYYSNAVFLSGPKRLTLLVYQPYMRMGDIMEDLEGWNAGGLYDVKIYNERQSWYDTGAERICNILITLHTINFRDALKIIGYIIGIHGRPPKDKFTEDEIRNMLKPFCRIEGMKIESNERVSELIRTIDRQLESGEVSTAPFKKMREIIDDPKNYERV